MIRPWTRCSCGLLLSALAGVGVETSWASDETFYFSELPVVASVSRLPQRIADAPTSVTVIDRELIKASGARDLSDVLRLVPGFQTFPNNTEAAQVTYHGMSDGEYSPRLQVLVDGRSLHSPLFSNGVNWATIPVALEDIERIEVVRGTNAVSYGSNAFLGVVNIITVDPALAHGFSVATSYGSQNVRDYAVRAGGRIGDVGDFRFTYKQQNDDGLNNRWDWIDSFRSRLFDFRSDFSLSDRDSLQFSIGQVEGVTQRGRLNTTTWQQKPEDPIRDMRQTDVYVQFLWRRVLSPTSDLQLRYSYVVDRSSDEFTVPFGGRIYRVNQSGDEGARHELEIQNTLKLVDTSRLVWGASWRTDSLRSDWTLPGQGAVQRDLARIFGNLEWKPAHWFTGNAGISGENDSMAGFHLAPRVSGSFHLSPENTIRTGYSRAYRTGSILNYRGDWWTVSGGKPKYQFAANPDMPPERMDTLEIGYLGDWRERRMSLDLRVFNETIRDRLLSIDQNTGNNLIPDTIMPIQKVWIRGFEYQYKWQVFDTTRIVLNQTFAKIGSSYLQSALLNPNNTLGSADKSVAIREQTEYSMPHRSSSLLLMQKLPWNLDFSVAGYWQDRMKWSTNSWSQKYRRFDARLAYPFRWGGQGGEVAYTVQSLNGAHNEYKWNAEPSDRIVDRRQWVSLRLDF